MKIGKNELGRRTGEACILFKSESDAKKAYEDKQGANIGERWVELLIKS